MSRTWLGKRLQRNKRIFEVSVMTKYDPILLLLFLSGVVKLHFYVKWLSPFGSSPFLKCIWRITRSTAVASFHGWVLIRTKLLMSGNVYSISLETVRWSLSKSECFAHAPSAALLFALALGAHQSHLWTAASQHAFCFTCELCNCKPLYIEQLCSFVCYFSGFFVPFPRCLFFFFLFSSLAMCCSSCVYC